MQTPKPSTKTMSCTEIRRHWGSFIRSITEDGYQVIVESYGQPKVVAMSYVEYLDFREFRDDLESESADKADGLIGESK